MTGAAATLKNVFPHLWKNRTSQHAALALALGILPSSSASTLTRPPESHRTGPKDYRIGLWRGTRQESNIYGTPHGCVAQIGRPPGLPAFKSARTEGAETLWKLAHATR